jgi:hypothetical protein
MITKREVHMKNIKFITVFAACGFLLSFAAGLFSHSGVGHIILMAVIFAAVFGGLAFLIQFLMEGILRIDAQTSPAAPDVEPELSTKKGGLVDIVVKDEDLPSEENSPQFFVGSNHQMLTKSDYSPADREPEKPAEKIDMINEPDIIPLAAGKKEFKEGNDDGFVPVPLQKTAENISGREDWTGEQQLGPAYSNNDLDHLEDDSLDELPELQDLKTSESDENVIKDSDFSKAGNKKEAKGDSAVQDAQLMAKAISTVLSKDKDN